MNTATQPFFADGQVTLWHGDALAVLQRLEAGSADCCVTSPPYFGLRDYGQDGQYGLEASPAEHVETMRQVFAEVRRVLADDGTLWLNLGDSYGSSSENRNNNFNDRYHGAGQAGQRKQETGRPSRRRDKAEIAAPRKVPGRRKSLLMIPERVAMALLDDGWILRNRIVWAKPNGMPDPTSDRLTNRHEALFLFVKAERYWFDLDQLRVPTKTVGVSWEDRKAAGAKTRHGLDPQATRESVPSFAANAAGRNPGDVWEIPTQPFTAAHFAVMPLTLASRCIAAGCKPDGTVLDPFSGSGTTGFAAARHGRRYVGIDLSAEYLDLSLRTRLHQAAIDFGDSA